MTRLTSNKGKLSASQMARAFAARNKAYDGRFVAGVSSTMIYCRPSCPARRPRPENTIFFISAEEAERQGFRACKRCAPQHVARDSAAVAKAVALLSEAQKAIPLAQLARKCGYSAGHLQRVFSRSVGLSPAAFYRALRDERARNALSEGGSVTDAIYKAGYESPSRFYENLEGKLGMTPSAWVNGGKDVRICWAIAQTTLGPMLVAASDKGVCRLSFNEGEGELSARFPNAQLVQGDGQLAHLLQQVLDAVEQPASFADIPLDMAGTAFQQRVWEELKRIPAGETRSYGDLAAALGNPKASRAVGGANGANPVAVLVPCHRVIAADGSLGGYAYGDAIKRELLKREAEG